MQTHAIPSLTRQMSPLLRLATQNVRALALTADVLRPKIGKKYSRTVLLAWMVRVLPLRLQYAGVRDANETASPEVAVARSANGGVPSGLLLSAAKLIV